MKPVEFLNMLRKIPENEAYLVGGQVKKLDFQRGPFQSSRFG